MTDRGDREDRPALRLSRGGRAPRWADRDDPRAPDRPIWCNGRIRRGADAAISLFDRGARDGLGLIETLRVEGRRPLEWHGHLERLVVSCAEIGYPVPPPPSLLAEAVAELLEAAALDDAAVRITVTRGIDGLRPGRPGCWIDAQPLAARLWRGTRAGAARAIVSARPFAPGPWGRWKTTSRMAYQQASDEARIARADEAILVSADGEVLEGAASNVFAWIGGELVTPPLTTGILPGVTRATVLRLCAALGVPVRERWLHRGALLRADEAFLTSAVQQVVPLARIDARELPGRDIGRRLLAAYRENLAPEAERGAPSRVSHAPPVVGLPRSSGRAARRKACNRKSFPPMPVARGVHRWKGGAPAGSFPPARACQRSRLAASDLVRWRM